MKTPRFWMVILAVLIGGAVGLASAKLPPPSDEAKAKAAAAKAKSGEAAKQAAEALAKAQDRVAERYKKGQGMKAAVAPDKKK